MIAQKIKTFLQTNPVYADLLPADFGGDFSLIDSGALDSIGIFELVMFLEKNLGVRVASEDIVARNFRDLNAIEQFVRAKTS